MIKKNIWAIFQRNIELFTQKIVTKLSKIWVSDPRSGIRKKTYSGSRIQGPKRHRKHWGTTSTKEVIKEQPPARNLSVAVRRIIQSTNVVNQRPSFWSKMVAISSHWSLLLVKNFPLALQTIKLPHFPLFWGIFGLPGSVSATLVLSLLIITGITCFPWTLLIADFPFQHCVNYLLAFHFCLKEMLNLFAFTGPVLV